MRDGYHPSGSPGPLLLEFVSDHGLAGPDRQQGCPPVNAKQRRFAEEYVVDHNGTAAAIRAGYGKPRARKTASELLHRPDVAQLVTELDAEVTAALGIDAEKVTALMWEYAQGGLEGRVPAMAGARMLEALAEIGGVLNARQSTTPDPFAEPVVFTLHFDRDLEEELD